MWLFDVLAKVIGSLIGCKPRLFIQKNAIDVQLEMIKIACETDSMLRDFLKDLRVRYEHDVRRMANAEDILLGR